MITFLTNVVTIGSLAAYQSRGKNRIAKHDQELKLSTPLRRIQRWIRVRCFADLSYPERLFLARKPWSDSQSIPVKVVTGKVANGRLPAGVGICGRTHPPHRTARAYGAMRTRSPKPPLSQGASDASKKSNHPFFEEKGSVSLNGWLQRGII